MKVGIETYDRKKGKSMLMMAHKSDIDHILHELEEIEFSAVEPGTFSPTLAHDKQLAKEVIDDFIALMNTLEDEEFASVGIVYDSKMVEDMCLVTYYMSVYGYRDLFDQPMTLEEAVSYFAKIIGCHAEGLLNMKHMYDTYLINSRNGWPQDQGLTNDMMFVIRVSDGMTQEEMNTACRRIIE